MGAAVMVDLTAMLDEFAGLHQPTMCEPECFECLAQRAQSHHFV